MDATCILTLPEKEQQKDIWEVRDMNSLEWGKNSSHHYNITLSKNVSEQWLNQHSFWNNIDSSQLPVIASQMALQFTNYQLANHYRYHAQSWVNIKSLAPTPSRTCN